MHQSMSLQYTVQLLPRIASMMIECYSHGQKRRPLVYFSEIKQIKVLQTCIFSEIVFCLNILNIWCVNHSLCVRGVFTVLGEGFTDAAV